MPPKGFEGRALTLYFDSPQECKEILAAAQAAKTSMSLFCREMIHRGMEQPTGPAPSLLEDARQAKEEAAQLRRALRDKEIALKKLETDLFGLKHSIFAHPEEDREIPFSSDLIEILRRGKIMRPAEIMKELGIDSGNMKAIQILAGHLHALQDMRMVEEGPRGWSWIG